MIRPFGLRDVTAVRQLQRNGIWLDLFHYLLQRRGALELALIAPVPWVGTGLASYVWQSTQGVRGFVQMLKHPGRYEADVLFLAPAINQQPYGPEAWEHLLAFCVGEALNHGLRRLFASLPEGRDEIEVLANLGFAIYSNEQVLVLPRPPKALAVPQDARLRQRRDNDVWWLRRLYNIYTPMPVQQAEGMNNGDKQLTLPLAWWELAHQHGYVLDEQGDVVGAVQLVTGRKAHWLLLHGNTGNSAQMALLLQQGLHEVAGSHRPVYCCVRDYQGGLSALLTDYGFEPFAQRSRLVKHLAARAKVPEMAHSPALAVERPG